MTSCQGYLDRRDPLRASNGKALGNSVESHLSRRHSPCLFSPKFALRFRFPRSVLGQLAFTALGLLCSSAGALGQTQQPFLIAGQAGVPAGSNLSTWTFTRDVSTGALTLLPNTAVTFSHPCEPNAAGAKDVFLFGACGEGLSMYTLDGATGVIAEVPASPFAASTGNSAAMIVAEATGQYVYLLKANFNGSSSSNNLFLDTFQIDQQGPTLVAHSSQTLPVAGAWVNGGAVADPNGHGFAVLVNQSQGGAQPVPVLYMVTFDPSSGLPILPANGMSISGVLAQSLQIGSKGQHLSVNYGESGEFLNIYQLSTSNFQISAANTAGLPSIPFASRGVFFDPSETLIYVQSLNPLYPGSGDPTNFPVWDVATLTELPSPPVTFEQANEIACGVLDPYGPFAFCENLTGANHDVNAGIAAYEVDPITGVPTAAANSPFYTNLSIFPLLLTATASQQNSSTPVVGWSPSGLTFAATIVGQSSASQSVTFKNVGSLPVTFSSVSISGANAGDFSKTDQCSPLVVLAPGLSCIISVTFSPAKGGTSQAMLVVADDAAGSPQQISLAGTALPPTPAVSLNPSGTLAFPGTVTEGTNSSPQSVVLTNTGTGLLHVTSIAMSGFNANDFVVGTTACLGTVASSANCSIPITFAPLAAGIRTATLEITDDAADSPQSLTLNGNASPALSLGPAPSGSTSATVSPGQTAQYNLQIAPGSGYSGTITLACSGAPLGATCQLPSSVQVSNGNAAPFSVTVTTSGGSGGALPFMRLPETTPSPGLRPTLVLAMCLAGLFLLAVRFHWSARPRQPRFTFVSGLAVLIFFVLATAGGCGGGSSVMTTPPPIITPQGTFTITVTPAASNASGKPLQLQAIQLTLTVN